MERKSAEIGEIIYGKAIRPFLLKAVHNDPEKLHKLFLAGIYQIGKRKRLAETIEDILTFRDRALQQKIWGLDFWNPISLAAGFDKNGFGISGIAILGVGFYEIGTLTPEPQKGFSGIRIHYLSEDKALINKMGFPNNGVKAVTNYLNRVKELRLLPLGINIGKGLNTPIENSVEDYLYCLEISYAAGDFFIANVSCPHMLGLSELRDKEYFENLIFSLKEKIKELAKETGLGEKPLLVKISPDDKEEKLSELLDVCLKYKVNGIIAVNTTLSREGLKSVNRNKEGGMSGEPLFRTAVERVKYIDDYTQGKIPIIGAGGIFNASDAYEMLKAGASLIQIYTGFVYNIWKGPFFFREINQGIKELMNRDGIKRISDLRK